MTAFALSAALLVAATTAGSGADYRAAGRAAGGDRPTALRVAHALLAHPLDLQLTRVRCDRAAGAVFCGLTLAGVKFKHRVDAAAFRAEVGGLIRDAFAVDPAIAEVDLWVTVPAGAGKGVVVSGDFAQPSAATVYATTVTRAHAADGASAANVFWDPAFRAEIERGSAG